MGGTGASENMNECSLVKFLCFVLLWDGGRGAGGGGIVVVCVFFVLGCFCFCCCGLLLGFYCVWF